MQERSKVAGGLALGVLAVSSAATLILLAAPLPPLVIAAGRVCVTGAVLVVLGAVDLGGFVRKLASMPQLRWRVLLAAVLLAVHFGSWIASLSLTTVLRSTALVATQPVFAGLLGRWLGDRVSNRLYLGVLVSGVGMVVLSGGGGQDGGLDGSVQGDALALLGAVSAAGYLAVGRSVRDALPLSAYLGSVHLLAAVLLAGVAAATGELQTAWAEPAASVGVSAWWWIIALGVVPGVVGHGLFNWVVRHVPVHVVSLVILAEPVGATALAVAVLNRSVTGMELVGGALLLLGVAVGLPSRRVAPSGSGG